MSRTPGALVFAPADTGRSPGIQVAPMVDIVFLLICFFTFTSQLIQGQKDRAIELPIMKNPAGEQEVPADLTVNLRADDTLTVDGRRMTIADLGPVLERHVARSRAADRPGRVVIRADRNQRYARLDDVLEACRKVGLPQVIFRAEGER